MKSQNIWEEEKKKKKNFAIFYSRNNTPLKMNYFLFTGIRKLFPLSQDPLIRGLF